MEQILSFNDENLVGKTIERVIGGDYDDNFIFFTDKTFLCFDSDDGIITYNNDFNMMPNIHSCDRLYRLGFINEVEKNKILGDHNNEILRKREEHEINTLKRLLSKYKDKI